MINENCGGTPGNPRMIFWSDDSYACGWYLCGGCRDCCRDCKPVVGPQTGRMTCSKPNLSTPLREVPQRPQEPYNGPWDAPPKGAS